MKIHLAGNGRLPWIDEGFFDFYRLESFYYISKKERTLIHKYKRFMLDSGAFTFMNNAKGNINWDEYIEKYANFINQYNVKYFFELDIDSIVGIKEVERLRHKLEKITNKKCIPVWHKSRGKDYWLRMVKEYDYVAIGGIVTKEITSKEFKYFPWFLNEAKKQDCKVHALGFTNLEGLKKYPFYSVDSASWLTGNRFGSIYTFNGKSLDKQDRQEGQRVLSNETARHNFYEWLKFCRYAEHNY